MLEGFRYIVTDSGNVHVGEPCAAVLCNQPLVLFRDRHGQVYALHDRCPHKGVPLSSGWQEGDSLRCPFHGWRFISSGECIEVPSVTNPVWLQPFRVQLIQLAASRNQQELRWHLAQMLPRLELSRRDRTIVMAVFRRYLQDRSRIVKTFAMQGLADLAVLDPRLRTPIRRVITSLTRTGSPSMKSRGRKLLLQLGSPRLSHHAPIHH